MKIEMMFIVSTRMEYTIGAITYPPGKENKVVFTTQSIYYVIMWEEPPHVSDVYSYTQ